LSEGLVGEEQRRSLVLNLLMAKVEVYALSLLAQEDALAALSRITDDDLKALLDSPSPEQQLDAAIRHVKLVIQAEGPAAAAKPDQPQPQYAAWSKPPQLQPPPAQQLSDLDAIKLSPAGGSASGETVKPGELLEVYAQQLAGEFPGYFPSDWQQFSSWRSLEDKMNFPEPQNRSRAQYRQRRQHFQQMTMQAQLAATAPPAASRIAALAPAAPPTAARAGETPAVAATAAPAPAPTATNVAATTAGAAATAAGAAVNGGAGSSMLPVRLFPANTLTEDQVRERFSQVLDMMLPEHQAFVASLGADEAQLQMLALVDQTDLQAVLRHPQAALQLEYVRRLLQQPSRAPVAPPPLPSSAALQGHQGQQPHQEQVPSQQLSQQTGPRTQQAVDSLAASSLPVSQLLQQAAPHSSRQQPLQQQSSQQQGVSPLAGQQQPPEQQKGGPPAHYLGSGQPVTAGQGPAAGAGAAGQLPSANKVMATPSQAAIPQQQQQQLLHQQHPVLPQQQQLLQAQLGAAASSAAPGPAVGGPHYQQSQPAQGYQHSQLSYQPYQPQVAVQYQQTQQQQQSLYPPSQQQHSNYMSAAHSPAGLGMGSGMGIGMSVAMGLNLQHQQQVPGDPSSAARTHSVTSGGLGAAGSAAGLGVAGHAVGTGLPPVGHRHALQAQPLTGGAALAQQQMLAAAVAGAPGAGVSPSAAAAFGAPPVQYGRRSSTGDEAREQEMERMVNYLGV
jgi:hypothetical protein